MTRGGLPVGLEIDGPIGSDANCSHLGSQSRACWVRHQLRECESVSALSPWWSSIMTLSGIAFDL
jgi:hypothetical protein